MAKTSIVSVGGTIAPLVLTINHQKPDYVLFFASEQTERLIPEILSKLEYQPRDNDRIITPSPEVLGDCYRILADEIPKRLRRWGVDYSSAVVDYTGGTKTMSTALVLATIEHGVKYSYVGGEDESARSKGGIGIVLNGRERIWMLVNPYDELAVEARKKIKLYFQTATYAMAAKEIGELENRVSEKYKPFHNILKCAVEGYELWDKFKHKKANEKLRKAAKDLRVCASTSHDDRYEKLADEIDRNCEFLGKVTSGDDKRYFIALDLIANAKRRAELEGKFDDAVARLYNAIERLAQARLAKGYGINASDVKAEQIPQEIRDEFASKYTSDRDSKIKVGLQASYSLLHTLGDDLGAKYFERKDEIEKLLNVRNNSILGHGIDPVPRDIYDRLFNVALDLAGIKSDELPEFPIIEL